MRNAAKIQRAYNFLIDHAQSKQPFTADDLAKASQWTPRTTTTYLSKRLKEFVREEGEVLYAKPVINSVNLTDFQDLFGQRRRLFAEYRFLPNPNVLVYEFFMPLAQETKLRQALDNLFYKDTIEQRIEEIEVARIRDELHLPATSSDEDVRRIVLDFFDNNIFGYSIYTVQGRFRGGSLATHAEVAGQPHNRYLMDETTAVVRFILPVIDTPELPAQVSLFAPPQMSNDTEERADQMKWLFLNFFAEAVARSVSNEDEIWLMETGMRVTLYRWIRHSERQ